jgi:hypothetical protein
MSDLTITHGGISRTVHRTELKGAQGPYGIDKGAAIRVSPTLIISGETGVDDAAIANTEIPNAVIRKGGASKLVGVTVIDYENHQKDFDLFLMSKNNTALGPIDAAANISDANLKLNKVLAGFDVDWSQYKVGIASIASIHRLGYMSVGEDQQGVFPVMLQAESDSTSIYFSILQRNAVTWVAADSLEFIFHIEYL